MRNVILNNIKTGLELNIGSSSSYTTLKVEEVQGRLPEAILTNYFVGITIDRATTSDRIIGRSYPLQTEYICSVVVRIKNADYNDGQTELDTIVRRIVKYFANDSGSLNGLQDTTDDVTERVVTYTIESFDYISGEAKNKGLLHICTIQLSIKTDLII